MRMRGEKKQRTSLTASAPGVVSSFISTANEAFSSTAIALGKRERERSTCFSYTVELCPLASSSARGKLTVAVCPRREYKVHQPQKQLIANCCHQCQIAYFIAITLNWTKGKTFLLEC